MATSASDDELTRLQQRLKELQAESDALIAQINRLEAEGAKVREHADRALRELPFLRDGG
jgi:septal ring factor EnvC (AmiA/AmiB activator)